MIELLDRAGLPGWMALCGLGAFVLASLIGKPVIGELRKLKFGQKILEDGPTWHSGKQNTPTMGGLIFIIALAFSLLLGLPYIRRSGDWRPVLMVAFALIFGVIGFVDDYTKVKKKQNKGITALQKLLLQIAAAALFVTLLRNWGYLTPGLYIPFLNITWQWSWPLYLLFSIFVIVGADNAVNLTDGIDGLCASVTAVVTACFCIFFAVQQGSAALFAAGLLGGLLGFLIFNHYPAKTFMGDTGSLFLGGAVCAMAFAYNLPLVLVPLGLVYIIETLSDIIQVLYFKLTHGKRFFKMAPYHHHLELCGWSETRIVTVDSLLTLVMAALTLAGLSGFGR